MASIAFRNLKNYYNMQLTFLSMTNGTKHPYEELDAPNAMCSRDHAGGYHNRVPTSLLELLSHPSFPIASSPPSQADQTPNPPPTSTQDC